MMCDLGKKKILLYFFIYKTNINNKKKGENADRCHCHRAEHKAIAMNCVHSVSVRLS